MKRIISSCSQCRRWTLSLKYPEHNLCWTGREFKEIDIDDISKDTPDWCPLPAAVDVEALQRLFIDLLDESMSLYQHYPNNYRKTAEEYFAEEVEMKNEIIRAIKPASGEGEK